MDRVIQLGSLSAYLDGTVFSSNGELENNEQFANLISSLVNLAKNIPPHEDKYKKITLQYPDTLYTICLSNTRIHVLKFRKSKLAVESDAESIDAVC